MRISFHHVISISDSLTFMVGGVVSLTISSVQLSSLQAVNKLAAVHTVIVVAAVVARGERVEIVFTEVGRILETAIPAVVRVFLTASLVFSTNC